MHTGIPWQSWGEDARAVVTAYDIIDDQNEAARIAARDAERGRT